MVRTVQEARKAAGLEVSDRITLWLDASTPELGAALDEHSGDIGAEVLAVAVHRGAPDDGAFTGAEADLGLSFGLARA